MGETVIPEERLRVFISSAQSNENGFAWGDVRRRIKECLSVCPYLNPFIIEDNPSTTPSLQFFQSQLRKADLTVLLVKGEVRKGTAVEYAQATKWKKPLLIYFLKDDQPDLDVIKLKRELQTTDYCTYREVDNFDNSGNDITNIIWALDLNNISKGNILALRDALDQSLATIVEKGGSPQIIACLVRFDPVVFGCLESKENNGLTGIEEKLYKINMGGDAWEAILQDEITQAQNHFSAYNSDGVYAAFASDPYAMIGYISRKASDTNAQAICNILSEKFVPLAVEVLNSHVAVPTKESCANALCDVVALFIQHNISFPATLIDSLRNIDTTQGYDFVQYKSRAMLEIRIFMAKLMVGLLGKESLLTWCVEYNKRSLNERVSLAECIEKYLYYHKGETADALILSIVFQCADDESDEIRRIAYQTLSYLLDSNAKSLVENRIYQAMTDPSSSVRNKILSLCEKGLFEYDMARSIVEALTTDSNYAIRIRALAVKNDMGHPES